MLLDGRIPVLEFVLADPRCEPFLNRLDAELKDTKNIWRVRRDVIAFTKGLLNARRLREQAGLGRLDVSFHRKPLIWNLNITDGSRVTARAYFTAASGHDNSVEEMVLAAGTESRLAESIIVYYRSVRDDETTVLVADDTDLSALWSWPSLFKANATWLHSDTTEDPVYIKVIADTTTRSFETAWLDSHHNEAHRCRYFRPVQLSHGSDNGFDTYGGCGIRMNAISGITAEQLMFEIQRFAAANPQNIRHLTVLANAVVEQSFAALREFQTVWERLGKERGLRDRISVYPWRHQLTAALSEAGRFITHDAMLLRHAERELSEIGEFLEANASVPFRDAHLKNRLIDLSVSGNDSCSGIAGWLESHPPELVSDSLRQQSHDIDFETTRFLVTNEDDAWHILMSPNLGWKPAALLANGCCLIRNWWQPNASVHEMTVGLLGRSFRELCRRVWYSNVMPNAYQQRYRTEKWNHFLELAREAVLRQSQWPHVTELLNLCINNSQRIWRRRNPEPWEEPVVVADRADSRLPISCTSTDDHFQRRDPVATDGMVFISSNHKDYCYARKVNDFLMNRGVSTFFCETSLPRLHDADYRRQIDKALDRCRHMVVVTSSSTNVLSEWVQAEWGFFINEKRSQRKPGNLITMSVGMSPEELPPSLRYFQMISLGDEGLAILAHYVVT